MEVTTVSDYCELILTPQGIAFVDNEDFEKASKYQWRLDISHGYVYTTIKNENGRHVKTYLHRFVTNAPNGMVVDHINRDKKDNRKSNLQVVTQKVNAMFQVRTPHKGSGYIGVKPSKTGSKWRSSISVDGKAHHIGRFNNRHDAARAYNEMAVKLLGERASLNEIKIPKIALVGKLRSGKTEIRKYLQNQYGFTAYAFGTELKRYADEIFDVSDGEKPRALYQFFGQMCRKWDDSIWINKVADSISLDNPEDILIEDIRQENELDWAKANGFTIIRVTAPDEDRLTRAKIAGDNFTEADLEHETESHIDGFAVDYTVENNGTVDDLKRKIDEIMEAIG
jgi:dephospho-CoA kinase